MEDKQFLTENEIENFIKTTRPESKNIRLVSHGFHNVVAIVDSILVYRFPRNELSATRLKFESKLLKLLENKLNIPIPKVIAESSSPKYHITSYLNGSHLSPADLAKLDEQQAKSFGEQMASFMINLNSVIHPDTVTAFRGQTGLSDHDDEDWSSYLKRSLTGTSFPDKPWLENLARQQFDLWSSTVRISNLPVITVHDDLHSGNLLFDGNKLSGILDFGYAKAGTSAQELRLLPCMSNKLLKFALDAYQAKGGQAAEESEVKCWTVTTELSYYCNRLYRNETTHPSFIRSRNNLKQLIKQYSDLF